MADMFDILRASLFTGEEVPVTEWEPIFEEMKQQTVAALPGEWLPSHIDEIIAADVREILDTLRQINALEE